MPLPWKKANVNRISRFVADLQSPKRGGSLVVETGFPTSLIDLFVKNQSRWKKSSKKKRSSKVSDLAVPPSNSSIEESDNSIFLDEENIFQAYTNTSSFEVDHPEVGLRDPVSSRTLVLAFFVIALALGTKKVAIGITMSAFLLLLIEYLGKNLFRHYKPCSDAKMMLKMLIRRFFPFVCSNKEVLSMEKVKRPNLPIEEDKEVAGLNINDLIEEFEIVESNVDGSIEEIPNEKYNLDFLVDKKRYAEMNREKDVQQEEISQSRTKNGEVSEMFLRKLLSTKLRSSIKTIKKRKKEKKRDPKSSLTVALAVALQEFHVDEDGYFDARCYFEEVADTDNVASGEHRENHVRGDLGFVNLILLIFVGLFEGRIGAIALTLAACLLLTSVGHLRRFSRKP